MTILDQILEKVPHDAMIASTGYEGANIILYTKNKSFLMHGGDIIRRLVEDFKKRIELRADSSIRMDAEATLEHVNKTMPKDADVTNVFLEPARSLIIIESKNPGRAIGKDGDNLKQIKEKTHWTPFVRRESTIPSKITTNIRKVLYEDNVERRKFLHRVGERIYEHKKSSGKEMWARVSLFGGGRQVGRSCLLLQTPESKILLDCGVNVAASGSDSYPILTAPEFDLQDIDAVIISHAHLDHGGFLPYIFKYGYNGPVYCTAPTRDVMALLQLDYIKVSHAQAKNAIYSAEDIKQVVKNTITLDYNEVTDITPDVRVTLYNAGHILGSSMVHLHIGEGWHNVLYAGDFKTKPTKLLNPGHWNFPRVETLITETTYGGQDDIMQPREVSEKELIKLVKETIKKKGKVLIPVLGVGRAQEVMVIIEEAFRNDKNKPQIYVDGMVWDVTAIHNAYPSFLNKDIVQQIFYNNQDPFSSGMFNEVAGYKERQQVLNGGPCVVLATSGMLVGGPSVEYLKNFCNDKLNRLIFVGYQAEGSLGNKLQRGEKTFVENKEQYEIKLDIHTLAGLSGHSDRNELIDYVRKMSPTPRRIIVMHGENSKCLSMASAYHKEFRVETTAPRNLDAIRLR
jgi:uncharacterized protein